MQQMKHIIKTRNVQITFPLDYLANGLNFGGFIWERDTNLDFTQPLSVQLLEVFERVFIADYRPTK